MKKKVMFIIPSLVGGGAEKVLIDLISALDDCKYELFLVLFENKGAHLESIPRHVRVVDLGKKSRYSLFKLILRLTFHLRKIKPNTVVTFMDYANLITIFARVLSRVKSNFVITVHTHLSESLLHLRFRNIWKYLIKKLYNIPNYIVVPSVGVMKDLVSSFGCNQNKMRIIKHPIDIEKIRILQSGSMGSIKLRDYILAVGRLTKEKGYPFLIKAYHLISEKVKHDLVILGIGEEEDDIRKMAQDFGLQKRVHLLGFQDNPYKFMKNTSLFVLSSLHEGFAIVIIEAMACGGPVISTDCPSGPGEIITHGKNGILVPPANEKALAEATLKLLKDERLREQFSKEGMKRAEDFRIENILPQYEKLFLFD